MRKYGNIRTVRIEIEPDKVTEGYSWIKQANEEDYNIIATYHKYSVLGSDNASDLSQAASWWVSNYPYLRGAGAFTVNLMNEWGSHDQSPSSFADAYNNAISMVREVYSDYVIIDIPGWGQETKTAGTASAAIRDNKVVLSAHVYPTGWNSGGGHVLQASDMDDLMKTGRPCIIGGQYVIYLCYVLKFN